MNKAYKMRVFSYFVGKAWSGIISVIGLSRYILFMRPSVLNGFGVKVGMWDSSKEDGMRAALSSRLMV